MSQNNPHLQQIAALVIDLLAKQGYPEGCNVHILPDGVFRSDDGRPASLTNGALSDWVVDAAVGADLIAQLETSGKPILYDYEHNSLWGDSRAAGWITKLVYVAGRGLFGCCEWVPDAAEAIAKKVYRYSSPCFLFDVKTGRPTQLLSVALTNNPALGDLGAVDLVRRAVLSAVPAGALANLYLTAAGRLPGNPTGDDMTPEQIAALSKERDTLQTTVATLTTERDTALAQVAALKAEKEAAAAQAEADEKAKLIEAALSGESPKLVPAQKEWAEKQPLASLKEYLDAAAPIALGRQSDAVGGGSDGLTDEERAACSKMGVTPEQFLAARKNQAG